MKGFTAQHLMERPRGYRVRTKIVGSHRLIFAVPPGRRQKGGAKLLEVLHPQRENPSACLARKNPSELLIFGNPGRRANPAELLIFGNPAKRGKRNGPAETLYQEFHGKDPDRVLAFDHVPQDIPQNLTALGTLEAIGFGTETATGNQVHGDRLVDYWEKCSHLSFSGDNVKLASDPQGRQLYCVGGTQSLAPAVLRQFTAATRGKVKLGAAYFIVYNARKSSDGFQFSGYVHEFAENGGKRPTIYYDADAKQILIRGGSYRIQPEGIVN